MALPNRQPVAGGGFMSSSKVAYSEDTQKLLKVMMQESKLSVLQQRQLNQHLKRGESLPSQPSRGSPASASRSKPAQRSQPKKHGAGLRSKEAIEMSGAYERENYRPHPGKVMDDHEKERLQHRMAFGEDMKASASTSSPKPARPKAPEPEVDRFDEVLEEIEERRQFLAEMDSLGQGKEYRNKITTEISQLIRELELIDKARCREVQMMLERHDVGKSKT